jgi:hypothetical protein
MTPAATTLGKIRIVGRRPRHSRHRPAELAGGPLQVLGVNATILGLRLPKPVKHPGSRPTQPLLQLDERLARLAHTYPRTTLTL